MTALEILTLKLANDEISKTQKGLAIAEIEQTIKDYCHIPDVPQGLNFVWANMAADLIRYKPDSETTGRASSITEGDTSVSFEKDEWRDILDSLVLNYKHQLQTYRRVKW